MDRRESATLEAMQGIAGNADRGGWRQVTILEKEVWEAVAARLRASIDPSARRANLMVSGIRLAHTRDDVLAIGGARIKIVGETAPCRLMDETHQGLRAALRPDWNGGAFGYVIDGGEITVGDEVAWVEDDA